MKGGTLVALGNAILKGRATINEARLTLGPNSRTTHAAERNLRDMMDTSKFILNHN